VLAVLLPSAAIIIAIILIISNGPRCCVCRRMDEPRRLRGWLTNLAGQNRGIPWPHPFVTQLHNTCLLYCTVPPQDHVCFRCAWYRVVWGRFLEFFLGRNVWLWNKSASTTQPPGQPFGQPRCPPFHLPNPASLVCIWELFYMRYA
jgi:hypothetical protein